MPDYKEMYLTLFQAITESIEILQNVQIKTEEIYISSEPDIKLIKLNKDDDEKL